MSSAKEYNEKQLDSGLLTLDHITEMTKLWQEEHGISSDGYFGPKTAGTFEMTSIPKKIETMIRNINSLFS